MANPIYGGLVCLGDISKDNHPWPKDFHQNFTAVLEASLLGVHFFGQFFLLGYPAISGEDDLLTICKPPVEAECLLNKEEMSHD